MSDVNVPIASLELGGALAELCRAHAIPREWIENSPTVDDLVAEVLAQCERRLAAPDGAMYEADVDVAHGGVKDLLSFVRKATALRRNGRKTPHLVSNVEDLERLRNGSAPAESHTTEILAEVGTLCHQINNPLTSLMGRVQILRMKPDSDAQAVQRALVVIEESARRVATHVQELGHLVGRERERLLSRG